MQHEYAGGYTSLADLAQALAESTTEIPESLQCYIDYDRMGQDMSRQAIETGYQEVRVLWSR